MQIFAARLLLNDELQRASLFAAQRMGLNLEHSLLGSGYRKVRHKHVANALSGIKRTETWCQLISTNASTLKGDRVSGLKPQYKTYICI